MKKKAEKGIGNIIKSYSLTYGVIAFMLGRLELFGVINPIIAGFVSVFCYRLGFYTVALGAILGLLSIWGRIYISRYIGAILIMCAMNLLGSEKYKQGLSAALAVLCSGVTFAMFKDFSLYYAIIAVIEAVLAICVNIVLRENIGVLNIMDRPVAAADTYPREVERIAAGRLKNISSVFKKISRSYSEAAGMTETDIINEKQKILDTVTETSCSHCTMLEECWHKNCAATCRMFYSAIDSWIKTGEVSELPKSFRDVCGRYNEIKINARGCIELYMNNRMWRERLNSVKQLVAGQMRSAGFAIEDLYRDMEKSRVDKELSAKLYKGLTSSLVKSVAAVKKQGSAEIYMTLKSCHNCNICTDVIIPKIKEITGKDFVRRDNSCIIERDNCLLHLIEEPPIRISVASASASKDGSDISGDCYTFINIKGKCILAVADGMGSGSKAREESAASVELYEDFVSAGFESETTLDIINSVLLMREDRESFTTLDICTVDLYSGKTDFVKIGAVSTVVVHNDGVDIIRSSTLPVGILGQIDDRRYFGFHGECCAQ